MQSSNRPLANVTSLFFMWGFLTALNDILIPTLKGIFELSHTQAMLVNFAFFGAYFIGSVIYFLISMRSGDPINRIGYKNGIVYGLLMSAIGCWLFYPAAQFGSFEFFLGALFVLGLGFTLLQIAVNPFVALIGAEETASSRLNLSQAVNSFAKMIAPVLGGALIFRIFGDGTAILPQNLRGPYLIFGLVFVSLAMIFRRMSLPSFQQSAMEKSFDLRKFPHFSLGIATIFVYVGAEVSLGSNLVSFLGEKHIAGLTIDAARPFASWFEGGAMIGRFLGAISLSTLVFQKKIGWMTLAAIGGAGLIYIFSPINMADLGWFLGFLAINLGVFALGRSHAGRTLGFCALVNVILMVVAATTSGSIAMWSFIAAGLFNSIMWGNIFSLAIEGLGRFKSQGSSLLVMAILGGALLPLLVGFVADLRGLQASFFIVMLCFLWIAYYGFRGCRVGREA